MLNGSNDNIEGSNLISSVIGKHKKYLQFLIGFLRNPFRKWLNTDFHCPLYLFIRLSLPVSLLLPLAEAHTFLIFPNSRNSNSAISYCLWSPLHVLPSPSAAKHKFIFAFQSLTFDLFVFSSLHYLSLSHSPPPLPVLHDLWQLALLLSLFPTSHPSFIHPWYLHFSQNRFRLWFTAMVICVAPKSDNQSCWWMTCCNAN